MTDRPRLGEGVRYHPESVLDQIASILPAGYFTRDDVEAIRQEAAYAMGAQAVALFSVADRIAALLPPEDNHG